MDHRKRPRTRHLIRTLLLKRGYYIHVGNLSPEARSAGKSAVIKLWYCAPAPEWEKLTKDQIISEVNAFINQSHTMNCEGELTEEGSKYFHRFIDAEVERRIAAGLPAYED